MSITFISILVTHPKPTYSYILQHPNVSFIIEYKCTTFFSDFLDIHYTLGWKGIMNHNLTISMFFGLLSRNPKTFCHFDATPITIVEYHRKEGASFFSKFGLWCV